MYFCEPSFSCYMESLLHSCVTLSFSSSLYHTHPFTHILHLNSFFTYVSHYPCITWCPSHTHVAHRGPPASPRVPLPPMYHMIPLFYPHVTLSPLTQVSYPTHVHTEPLFHLYVTLSPSHTHVSHRAPAAPMLLNPSPTDESH